MPYRYALIDDDTGKILHMSDDIEEIKQRAGEEIEVEQTNVSIYIRTYVARLQTTLLLDRAED